MTYSTLKQLPKIAILSYWYHLKCISDKISESTEFFVMSIERLASVAARFVELWEQQNENEAQPFLSYFEARDLLGKMSPEVFDALLDIGKSSGGKSGLVQGVHYQICVDAGKYNDAKKFLYIREALIRDGKHGFAKNQEV